MHLYTLYFSTLRKHIYIAPEFFVESVFAQSANHSRSITSCYVKLLGPRGKVSGIGNLADEATWIYFRAIDNVLFGVFRIARTKQF